MCGINSKGLPLPVTFTSYTLDCACTDAVVSVKINTKKPVKFFISIFFAVGYRHDRIVTEPWIFFFKRLLQTPPGHQLRVYFTGISFLMCPDLMRTALKLITSFILILLSGIVLYINTAVYYKPAIQVIDQDTVNMDVLHQLRHLRHAMEAGAADDMQQLYPEGYIFMHALYGFAWHDFARQLTPATPLYKEAQEEISKSCTAVRLPEARAIFDENLMLPYGAYYTGWSSYLLGKKLSLEKSIGTKCRRSKILSATMLVDSGSIHWLYITIS